MPLYEYYCATCQTTKELFEKVDAAPQTQCPDCHSTEFKRIISKSFGMQFKGNGFYITDYKSSHEPQKQPKKDTGSCGSSCGCH